MMLSGRFKRIVIASLLILVSTLLKAQEKREILDYMTQDEYIVGGVSVSGIRYLDINALIGISGIRIGQEISIPGDVVSNAAKKLWQQGLFSDVRITIDRIQSDTVFLDIYLQERPRISSIKFNGIRTTETQDIVDKITLPVGSQLTSYILTTTSKIIKDHFIDFWNLQLSWNEYHHISWKYRFDSDSFPPGSMDDHVIIGGKYFDLNDTSYTLTPEAGGTRLDIAITYRVSTGFNWYAVPMANFLISDTADALLNLYKNRAESGRENG